MLLLLRLEKFASLRWREFFWKIKKWSTVLDLVYELGLMEELLPRILPRLQL